MILEFLVFERLTSDDTTTVAQNILQYSQNVSISVKTYKKSCCVLLKKQFVHVCLDYISYFILQFFFIPLPGVPFECTLVFKKHISSLNFYPKVVTFQHHDSINSILKAYQWVRVCPQCVSINLSSFRCISLSQCFIKAVSLL